MENLKFRSKNFNGWDYATEILTEKGIAHRVCNKTTSQINAVDKNGKVQVFFAKSGRIRGRDDIKGINHFVRLCKGWKIKQKESEVKGNDRNIKKRHNNRCGYVSR